MADEKNVVDWSQELESYPLPERDVQEAYSFGAEQSIQAPDYRPRHQQEMDEQVQFLQDLGREAKKQGLFWGGRFKNSEKSGFPGRSKQWEDVGISGWDPMHVQRYAPGQWSQYKDANGMIDIDKIPEGAQDEFELRRGRLVDAMKERWGDERLASYGLTRGFQSPGKSKVKASQHGAGLAEDFYDKRAGKSTDVLDRYLQAERDRAKRLQERQSEIDSYVSAAVQNKAAGLAAQNAKVEAPQGPQDTPRIQDIIEKLQILKDGGLI